MDLSLLAVRKNWAVLEQGRRGWYKREGRWLRASSKPAPFGHYYYINSNEAVGSRLYDLRKPWNQRWFMRKWRP